MTVHSRRSIHRQTWFLPIILIGHYLSAESSPTENDLVSPPALLQAPPDNHSISCSHPILIWPEDLKPSSFVWLPSSTIQQGALCLYQNPQIPIVIAFKSSALRRGFERLQKEYSLAMSNDPKETQRLNTFLQHSLEQLEKKISSEDSICLAYLNINEQSSLVIFTPSSSFFHDFELQGSLNLQGKFPFSETYYQTSLVEILLRIAKIEPDQLGVWKHHWQIKP